MVADILYSRPHDILHRRHSNLGTGFECFRGPNKDGWRCDGVFLRKFENLVFLDGVTGNLHFALYGLLLLVHIGFIVENFAPGPLVGLVTNIGYGTFVPPITLPILTSSSKSTSTSQPIIIIVTSLLF